MYLAFIDKAGRRRYEIRQSLFNPDRQCYESQLIFDLGPDPATFISCITDDICYFSEELCACLEHVGTSNPTTVLEELLWDFLPAEERRRLEIFRYRGRIALRPLSREDRAAIEHDIHLFDRRRLYYLRYGAVDQSRISRLNPKLYRPLLQKSRDEREFYFRNLEKVLHANELKTYVFAIFDLQRHFSQSYSATMPEALNQIEIADRFVADLCALSSDPSFWYAHPPAESLQEHLIRYLIMFFDYGYGRRSLFDDFLREFMGRHRTFRWPDRKPAISTDAVEAIFETKWQLLQAMSKRELTRLYRRRAKQLHPDSGGDHLQFIELNAAYASLIVRKSS
ncbi:MAG: J domain-containing protein [Desulfofustis sp.]|nr:J domain-containing protein [Desulfofustis sp.]